MNEFGEPNMGNPSVRFDEGRSESVELTTAVGSIRLLSLCLLYYIRVNPAIENLKAGGRRSNRSKIPGSRSKVRGGRVAEGWLPPIWGMATKITKMRFKKIRDGGENLPESASGHGPRRSGVRRAGFHPWSARMPEKVQVPANVGSSWAWAAAGDSRVSGGSVRMRPLQYHENLLLEKGPMLRQFMGLLNLWT